MRLARVVAGVVCVALSTVVVAAQRPATRPAGLPDSRPVAPDPLSVQRCGRGWRYPQAGWIVVHIQGEPYERGYQHGVLLAPEIAAHIRLLAHERSPKDPAAGWAANRLATDALFLRGYDAELLEEMKGIAAGATRGGASFEGRALDLLDIATVNSSIELGCLDDAVGAVPTGLEGKEFKTPSVEVPRQPPEEHCSAFVATGPATPDGHVMLGHITMWGLAQAHDFNVWLDVLPERGHRVVMQTYPGGIQSGSDYYMNDAGLIVTETTIAQTRFNAAGTPLASRIRRALQDGTSIDDVVRILTERNNGLYTNEWLIADAKTDEIAMFELGTFKTKLWRSSRDEWPGGTKGFYWGCNNAKDREVWLEHFPGVKGRPVNPVFRPADRDRAWLKMFSGAQGRVDEAFAVTAFTTPPLCGSSSLDAKFTTGAMAKELKSYALFGPPSGRTWMPRPADAGDAFVQPLVPNDWVTLGVDRPVPGTYPKARLGDLAEGGGRAGLWFNDFGGLGTLDSPVGRPVWHGTILPAADADIGLAAAFALFEPVASSSDLFMRRPADAAVFAWQSRYLTAVRRLGRDVPLAETKSETADSAWYDIAVGRGMGLLAALQARVGEATFVKLMDDFGTANAGKPVTTAAFRAFASTAAGADLAGVFDPWVTGSPASGLPSRTCWSIYSFEEEPEHALIVVGTAGDVAAQREAAVRLQQRIASRWYNLLIPIVTDREVTEEQLNAHHIVLVGRPATNAVARRMLAKSGLAFGAASFGVREIDYAHAQTALVAAADNPLNNRWSVVLYAGLSAEATWHCMDHTVPYGRNPGAIEVLLTLPGRAPVAGCAFPP